MKAIEYTIKKDYTKVIANLGKVHEILIDSQGLYHQDVARIYLEIGEVWYLIGDYDEAIFNYKLALQINLKILKSDDGALLANYASLGMVCDAKNDKKSVLEYERKIFNF